MLPGHCKDVAVKKVEFDLTAENIEREIQGKRRTPDAITTFCAMATTSRWWP